MPLIRRLERIREQIVAIEDISYDNVVLIYQQLIGAIIKALVEEKVKISRFLGNGRKGLIRRLRKRIP